MRILLLSEAFALPQEWDLRKFEGKRELVEYEDLTYAYLHFKLNIRRRTLYYFSNLIMPCVIIGELGDHLLCSWKNVKAEGAKVFIQRLG